MLLERTKIETGLLNKGFVKDNGDHRIFRLTVGGRITGIKTWTSHGSKYKDYGDGLLDSIKRELRLDTKSQLVRLIDCSLKYQDYISYLRAKGLRL